MRIETSFDPHAKGKMRELERTGRITEINITTCGIKYYVRYFDKAEANSVWFLEEELKKEE